MFPDLVQSPVVSEFTTETDVPNVFLIWLVSFPKLCNYLELF